MLFVILTNWTALLTTITRINSLSVGETPVTVLLENVFVRAFTDSWSLNKWDTGALQGGSIPVKGLWKPQAPFNTLIADVYLRESQQGLCPEECSTLWKAKTRCHLWLPENYLSLLEFYAFHLVKGQGGTSGLGHKEQNTLPPCA